MVHNPCFSFNDFKINQTNEIKIHQIIKLKSGAKNKTRATLRITKKNFQDEELSDELYLTARQKSKIRNYVNGYNT